MDDNGIQNDIFKLVQGDDNTCSLPQYLTNSTL